MLVEGLKWLCMSTRRNFYALIQILMGYQLVRWLVDYYTQVTTASNTNAMQIQPVQGFDKLTAQANVDDEEEEAEAAVAIAAEPSIKISANTLSDTRVMGNAGSSSISGSSSIRNRSVQKRHSEVFTQSLIVIM